MSIVNFSDDSNCHPSSSVIDNNDYIEKEDLYNILRSDIPQCYICLRSQSQKVRLFKWPRDNDKRKNWCNFFELDEEEILADFGNTFICSLHFDPSQFLYVSGKIFWKSDVSPMIVDPNTSNVKSYPWEKEEILKNVFEEDYQKLLNIATKAFKDSSVISISYRKSNFRPTGPNKKHPVVILKDLRFPCFYYEFSHNRTNSRGKNFYYCLMCKKMKDKTGIKDNVRTISISNGKVATSAHPFTRHHSHCSPGIEEDEFVTNTGLECNEASLDITNESYLVNSKVINNYQRFSTHNCMSNDNEDNREKNLHSHKTLENYTVFNGINNELANSNGTRINSTKEYNSED
ncbi:Zinc finger, C2CH-type domain-containing protein [Strongyloides ratti]|uniref:Zinc finger, C2CH-type domain-containing protein n=1 Tax=Strongyloides ratti TaxID=34506 RepID=A0A090L7W1_STRRB|nr:Zinc finger, C2CH-type domain-containing protein [Strongyloides ratti]CEF65891.1 Zinc finger, C2CH-type domain-containing protein [Strongyloides ratti]